MKILGKEINAKCILSCLKDKFKSAFKKNPVFIGINGYGRNKQITIKHNDGMIRVPARNISISYKDSTVTVNGHVILLENADQVQRLVSTVQKLSAPTTFQTIKKWFKYAFITYAGVIVVVMISMPEEIDAKSSENALNRAKEIGIKSLSDDERVKMQEFGIDDPYSE